MLLLTLRQNLTVNLKIFLDKITYYEIENFLNYLLILKQKYDNLIFLDNFYSQIQVFQLEYKIENNNQNLVIINDLITKLNLFQLDNKNIIIDLLRFINSETETKIYYLENRNYLV